MKTLHTLAIGALCALALISCDRKFEKTVLAPEASFTAATLTGVSEVIVDANNNKVEAVVFNWTSASMGAPVQIAYDLYFGYDGASVLAGTSYNNNITVSKSDLNSFATTDLGVAKNVTAELSAWVVSRLSGVDGVATKTSNTITFEVTTYDAPKTCIYMPGHYQNWNATGTDLWEIEGGTKQYRILVQFAANDEGFLPFKIHDGTNWLGLNDGFTATWDADFGDKDGNLTVPADEPINFITVDMSRKSISREAVTGVSLIGSMAASGWSTDLDFTYNAEANVWESPATVFAASDEFLIRLSHSWDSKYKYGDGTVSSSEVPGALELVNSGDAANIASPGAGTYVVKLYGNHTPMVIEFVQQ